MTDRRFQHVHPLSAIVLMVLIPTVVAPVSLRRALDQRAGVRRNARTGAPAR